MDGLDDELDIELRDPDDIGCRIVLLAALSIWPGIESGAERRSWQEWLDDQGVLAVATPGERGLLAVDTSSRLTAGMVDICERALDAIGPLAWATALTERVSILESAFQPEQLADSIPMPRESLEPFLDQLILRDENTVAVERERAELWNWRLSSEAIRRESTGRDRAEVQEAIREVVLESAISFALDEVDLEDYVFDGIAVMNLEGARLEALTVTSEERLRAFNWLCGLTEWDSIHIQE